MIPDGKRRMNDLEGGKEHMADFEAGKELNSDLDGGKEHMADFEAGKELNSDLEGGKECMAEQEQGKDTKSIEELEQVVWESTYRCGSNCVFCYNCWKADYKTDQELTVTELLFVLNKLPPMKRFVISGGEPLLRDDIEEIVITGKRFTDEVILLTSGVLIDRDLAQMLKRYDVFVQVPIHGLEGTHNYLTGDSEGFKKMVKGIAWLKKEGVRFGVATVVNKKNVTEFMDILELAVALGASGLQIIRFIPGGEGMAHGDLMLIKSEYLGVIKTLDRICGRYKVFGALGISNLPCVVPNDAFQNINMGTCGAGIDWFAIDPSGRARMCNHSPTILGDLRFQEFNEIWNHPLMTDLRAGRLIAEECEECKDLDVCLGGCRAAAETYYGSFHAPDPLMLMR